MRIYTWYGLMVASPIYSQALNRYAQATNLSLLQRHDEVLRLYNSFAENSIFDLIYLAPAHLRQAEIYDLLNQPDKATEHYEAFVALWQHADSELVPQLNKARQRISELSLATE